MYLVDLAKMILPTTHFNVTWGLAKRVCHQDDLMLPSCLADDLNSDLGRSRSLFGEKSALIFSRTSRDRAVGVYCTMKGAATDRFGGPPYK
jgi:hypothetical protein